METRILTSPLMATLWATSSMSSVCVTSSTEPAPVPGFSVSELSRSRPAIGWWKEISSVTENFAAFQTGLIMPSYPTSNAGKPIQTPVPPQQ